MCIRNSMLIISVILLTACSDVSFTSKVANDGVFRSCVPTEVNGVTEEVCISTSLVNQNFSVPVSTTKPVDILFVVDNSGSMKPQLLELGNRFPNFISTLAGLDWQICVTTTDILKEDGRILTFSNGSKWINTKTVNPEAEFLALLSTLPGGSGDERGIMAINRALDRDEACLRQGAALSTVVLSDEDERSTGGNDKASGQFKELEARDYPSSVFETLAAKQWSDKIFTAHSIVIAPGDTQCYATQAKEAQAWYGTQYAELTLATDGIMGDICATNYGAQLKFIGMNIKESLASVPLLCAPVTQSGIDIVLAAGVVQSIVPATTSVATLVGQRINFAPALPEGTAVSLKYYCVVPPIL